MMAVDCVTPGYAPFQGFDITANLGEYMKVFDELMAYDFETFCGGHLSATGSKKDVEITKEFTMDVYQTVKRIHNSLDQNAVAAEAAQIVGTDNKFLLFKVVLDRVTSDSVKNWSRAGSTGWPESTSGWKARYAPHFCSCAGTTNTNRGGGERREHVDSIGSDYRIEVCGDKYPHRSRDSPIRRVLSRRARRYRAARGQPTFLRLGNIWLTINAGGGPTDDKPEVVASPPRDPNVLSIFLNLRVADIRRCHDLWRSRGAKSITEPKVHATELRCYMRDPDGYLIEVGQTTMTAGPLDLYV